MAHIKLIDYRYRNGRELPKATIGEFDSDIYPQSKQVTIMFKGKEYDIIHITFDYDKNVVEYLVNCSNDSSICC